jgi:outer membrane protein assembly factor BamB
MSDDGVASKIWRTSGGSNCRAGLFEGTFRMDATPASLTASAGIRAAPVFDAISSSYLADMAGGVFSYTGEGRKRWGIQLPDGICASPVLDPFDRHLFVGTLGGEVYALDSSSGRILWKKTVPSTSDQRILSDLLYLPQQRLLVMNSWGGQFFALDVETGTSLKAWPAGISPSASAAASAEEVIYAVRTESSEESNRSGLLCFTLDSRSRQEAELFFEPLESQQVKRVAVAASPLLDEVRRRVYVVANVKNDSKLYAFCLSTQKILWSRGFTRFIVATPALLPDGSIAVADLNGVLHVISSSGSLRYRYHTGAYYLLSGPICDVEGKILVADPEGKLHLVLPGGTGEVVFEADRSIEGRLASDPGGRLHLPSMDGQVHVFS